MATEIPVEAPSTFEDKLKAMHGVTTAVNKEHGAGSMIHMGSRVVVPIPAISTRLPDLDYRAIGIGGVPRGRHTEVFGPYSCGKTTLALQVVAEAQSQGGVGAYIDAEHALDPTYARALGVDMDNMFLSQPDYGEQALDIAERIILTNACDVLVIDSVAALVPKAELDADMEAQQMGLHARMMSKAMRKLTGITRKSGTALIWINQVREKIGEMYGNPETVTGGRSLGFYASVRIRMSQTGKLTGEGSRKNTHFKVVKNKVGIPFLETDADVEFGKGFDGFGSTVKLALDQKIIERSGAWYSYKGERIGQGLENASATLAANTDMYADVQKELQERLTKV